MWKATMHAAPLLQPVERQQQDPITALGPVVHSIFSRHDRVGKSAAVIRSYEYPNGRDGLQCI